MPANSPPLNPISYEVWLNNVLSVVKDIADRKKQEELWLHPNFSWENPNELVCRLFDDYLFEEFIEQNRSSFSARQRLASNDLLQEFQRFLAATPNTLDAAETLRDPQWHAICNSAVRFTTAFEGELSESSS